MKRLVVVVLVLASAAYGEIYTWKDARGTAFYTNSLDEIPARYRARAQLLDVATGKKAPITAAQPGAAATPGQQGAPQQSSAQQAPQVPAPQLTPPNPAPAKTGGATAATQAGSSPGPQLRARKSAQRPHGRSEEE